MKLFGNTTWNYVGLELELDCLFSRAKTSDYAHDQWVSVEKRKRKKKMPTLVRPTWKRGTAKKQFDLN